MSLSILGVGTATPPRQIAQSDAATLAIDFANAEADRERTLAGIDALLHAHGLDRSDVRSWAVHGNGVWAWTHRRTRAADT
jgi:predicted naringenin-chalcone synthase